jgi:hypothetical protein
MKIIINIKTDNAAFSDNPTEILDCLKKIADAIGSNGSTGGSIHDSNGNKVGTYTVEGE